ncbi:hypothetical protein K8R20_02245 [bacterium]|nr:hypothetical protein [bacterium]
MRKTFLILLVSLLILPSFLGNVYAQEDSLTTNTKYFDISLECTGQSAWDKSVTYVITVIPKIDSPKTQILWDTPTLVGITPKHEEFVDLYMGQTYSFKAILKPEREGSFTLSVNLIAWQHDTNYTNSVSDVVTFDSNLVVQPVDPGYTFGNIAKILILTLLGGLGLWGLVILLKKSSKALVKWLTPPN